MKSALVWTFCAPAGIIGLTVFFALRAAVVYTRGKDGITGEEEVRAFVFFSPGREVLLIVAWFVISWLMFRAVSVSGMARIRCCRFTGANLVLIEPVFIGGFRRGWLSIRY